LGCSAVKRQPRKDKEMILEVLEKAVDIFVALGFPSEYIPVMIFLGIIVIFMKTMLTGKMSHLSIYFYYCMGSLLFVVSLIALFSMNTLFLPAFLLSAILMATAEYGRRTSISESERVQ
jgi:predicted membrane channel-forming protein YqfA (hemolysin III family)